MADRMVLESAARKRSSQRAAAGAVIPARQRSLKLLAPEEPEADAP